MCENVLTTPYWRAHSFSEIYIYLIKRIRWRLCFDLCTEWEDCHLPWIFQDTIQFIGTYKYARVWVCVHAYVCVCVCMCTIYSTPNRHTHTHTHYHLYACTRTNTHIHTQTHKRTHTHTHTHTISPVCTHTHTHTHTFYPLSACTNACAHTHTYLSGRLSSTMYATTKSLSILILQRKCNETTHVIAC